MAPYTGLASTHVERCGVLTSSLELKTMEIRKDTLMARLDCKPGATHSPAPTPVGRTPSAMIYKVMGKMFAIVGLTNAFVILKADPYRVELLKEAYSGVGHRSHLDRRYWISVSLDADVPWDEIEGLVDRSYELVCETLSRKQREQLGH